MSTDILKVISTRVEDPFESDAPNAQVAVPEVERELERDGRGRPMLLPRQGPRIRVPYSRMSSLSDYISDGRGVHIWEQRYLAIAMAQSPDLCALAAVETYNTGFGAPEPREKRESGKRVDDIIRRALDRRMIHEKADYGTAFHALTEPGNDGKPVDEAMAKMVSSFSQTMRGVEIIDTEVFTANDELMAGGTFDHLIRVPGYEGLCIGDKKSGKFHPETFALQGAGYANADIYDPKTDERLTFEEKYGEPINRKWAFLIWTPAEDAKNGDARTLIYPIDIEKGYLAAKVAVWVRDFQSDKSLAGRALNPVHLARQRALRELSMAETSEQMNEIYAAYSDIWTPELTEAGRRILAAPAPAELSA